MKTQQPKLKTQLFSCAFFRHCTQSVLSPTAPHSSHPLPLYPSDPPQPPPAPSPDPLPASVPSPVSESSSSSTSQSFTQWRFPIPNSPVLPDPQPDPIPPPYPLPPPISSTELQELLHLAELQLTTGSESDRLAALHLLEHSLVPNPPSDPVCPPELMRGLVASLKNKFWFSKPATKILLALCLSERNRHLAVEAGLVSVVVETVMELEDSAAERALATLELMCTVAEGAEEVRAHALAVPVMVAMMGKTARPKEYAISVLGVIYGGRVEGNVESAVTAPPEEVARAVALAMQGDCSARAKRKGAQLLKALRVQEQ